MDRKAVGAVIGAAGAQILTVVLFQFLAKECECIVGICTHARCVGGQGIGEFWATYGLGGTVVAAIVGFLVAGD